ncbi:GMC family oxidoreductase [Steroidobacter sp. S1-65]|uniref:GMC family oxidoreductase n=1 Tax=Steroidobacter gossypii TaxID=2805490 RepID=A0ABS1WRY1_9GAMM|nr:GMC family oxidoreductase [Steroidobacter gossypii]MBM0103735.1 GMC family oxidoreductase [Steroidobacter gossypii]
MPGNLPYLQPTAETVAVQRTTFTIDVLGRYICSLWHEAVGAGGAPFDAVVIGAGMYGAYCAQRLYRMGKRVLLLEAGSFLVSEHVQNLARIGLDVPSPIWPGQEPGQPREHVWGIPWRGNDQFPGLAYCVGGKSLYWGGWCPRMTAADLAQWPAAVANFLGATYPFVEDDTGVTQTVDFITGHLYDALLAAVQNAAPLTPNIDAASVGPAPLAVQGSPPASGLFSFDKFSACPLLVDAIREDAGHSAGNDAARRLFLVPHAHVTHLEVDQGRVTALHAHVDGAQQRFVVPANCKVILAMSTIESTRLALRSFPTPLMGRNLMVHTRTDFTVRIRRAVFGGLPIHLQTAALIVRGATPNGVFHLQVTAAANQQSHSDELLFRMIPDIDSLEQILANHDSDWVAITLRGIAEMKGDRNSAVPHAGSWMNLSPYENDEFGVPRAWVNLALNAGDLQLWQDMDQAAIALAQRLAGNASNIEYLYDNGWQTTPPPLNRPFPEWHRGLGTTYHECGTLWMGDDPSASVTDINGRFHHISNAYACDQSLFPTGGSANPVLTGLALARRVAEAVT